jgi:hypothetical protein
MNIVNEIPEIGGGTRIDPVDQLKAIVDEYMVPQLKQMAIAIVELRKRVVDVEEKNRTITVNVVYPKQPGPPPEFSFVPTNNANDASHT